MPVAKIISIPYMAQTMMATTLLKPDSARARPSTLINSDTEYRKIFSLDFPIDIYLKVIQIMKAVEIYLKPENCGHEFERKIITNIKYYVAMMVSIGLAGSKENIASKLAALPAIAITPELLAESLQTVIQEFNNLGATDQVAKGPELVGRLLS
jgi:hypothetical protein